MVLKTPGTPLVLCRRLGNRLVLPSLRDSASYQLDGVEAVRALLQHTLAEPAALRQAVEGGRYARSTRTADGATAHAVAFTVGYKMRVPPRASGTWRWTPYAGALRGDAVEGSAPRMALDAAYDEWMNSEAMPPPAVNGVGIGGATPRVDQRGEMTAAVEAALLAAYAGLLKRSAGAERGKVVPDLGTLDELAHEAHRRALVRGGGTALTVRDVNQAAVKLHRLRGRGTEMVAGLLPDHYGELHEQLENLRRDIQRGQRKGIPAPTIIVDGDVGGDVAAVFQLAGADVATCGLAVKSMRGLRHFEGDPSLVQNQGWDLVISFPNLADVERDGRREEVLRARRRETLVSTFLERCNAEAPFRAVQQPETHGDPPMGMQPSQSIRP